MASCWTQSCNVSDTRQLAPNYWDDIEEFSNDSKVIEKDPAKILDPIKYVPRKIFHRIFRVDHAKQRKKFLTRLNLQNEHTLRGVFGQYLVAINYKNSRQEN